MTRFRKRPTQRFIAFLVKPSADFKPESWQDVPKNYRVIEYVGKKQFRGRADAWRFIENKARLDQNEASVNKLHDCEIEKWAVVID